MIKLQNHDTSRISEPELIDGMNALSLFLPGVVTVYYGGEIGMVDTQDSMNCARSPMQWDDTKFAGMYR